MSRASTTHTAVATACGVLLCGVIACGDEGALERSELAQGSAPPPSQRLVALVERVDLAERVHAGDRAERDPKRPEVAKPSPVELRVPPSARKPSDVGARRGPGIKKLRVEGGQLTGRTTDAYPVLQLTRNLDLRSVPAGDTLARVEIRMRATAGTTLGLAFEGDAKVDLDAQADAARDLDWPMTADLDADGELHTYTLTSLFQPIRVADTRHVLVRPSDQRDARFGIQSVRLVFRSEELADVASGVGWHDLGEIYRESIALRAGERVRIPLRIPARPVLDLAIGTPEPAPVRFTVKAERAAGDASGGDTDTVFERTVTTPEHWQSARVALDALAGEDVVLELGVDSDRPDALGYFGAAAVRDRVSEPLRQTPSDVASQPPQGVILFVADTLRADHLDAYGYARRTAPHIARLAAEGARFEDAVAQGTWTKVSTPSLLTGLYPDTHGVTDFPDRLPAAADTLAEIFRDAGYATLSLSSIVFTGRFTNLHQGFETVHEMGSFSEPESSKTAREYVDRLLPWLDLHRDQRFFVFIQVFDPHDPYEPRPPYDSLFAAPGAAARFERAREQILPKIAEPFRRNFFMPKREELLAAGYDPTAFTRDAHDWYDGSVYGMDTEVGRVMERLRELGLERKTLVVFTSDHGEEFFEHGGTFHGQTTYGELSRVPLVMWRPGVVPAATVVTQTVQSIDIFPTIVALSGLPIPEETQGRSLEPLVTGRGRWTPRPAVTVKAQTQHALAPPPHDTESTALVWDGWKLVHHTRRAAGTPELELFNHGEDPLDQVDLAGEFPDVVERLAKELAAWRASVAGTTLPADPSAPTSGLNDAEIGRLRALGYAE